MVSSVDVPVTQAQVRPSSARGFPTQIRQSSGR
jgi:hypothetical protein